MQKRAAEGVTLPKRCQLAGTAASQTGWRWTLGRVAGREMAAIATEVLSLDPWVRCWPTRMSAVVDKVVVEFWFA